MGDAAIVITKVLYATVCEHVVRHTHMLTKAMQTVAAAMTG